jgi:hypothetical protein
MKKLLIVAAIMFVSGCDRVSQQKSTFLDGYAVRRIEGIKYVIVDDTNGSSIFVLYDTDGKPKICNQGL